MNQNAEYVDEIEFDKSSEIAKSGYDFFEMQISNDEKEVLDALIKVGEEDQKALQEFISNIGKNLKDNLIGLLTNDEKRKNALTVLVPLVIFLGSLQGGALEESGSEIIRMIGTSLGNIDQVLMYLYEISSETREVELYSDNPEESDEMRKTRIKFFLSDRVYDFVDNKKPEAIDKTIEILEKINNYLNKEKARLEAQRT
jgi:hypothetical protein